MAKEIQWLETESSSRPWQTECNCSVKQLPGPSNAKEITGSINHSRQVERGACEPLSQLQGLLESLDGSERGGAWTVLHLLRWVVWERMSEPKICGRIGLYRKMAV